MSRTMLSLQALQPNDEKRGSLQYLIERIKDQKGSFLEVTEESLEQEIKDGGEEAVENDDIDMDDGGEKVEDEKTRIERLQTARGEMLKQIRSGRAGVNHHLLC